jgi:hypothetical protein
MMLFIPPQVANHTNQLINATQLLGSLPRLKQAAVNIWVAYVQFISTASRHLQFEDAAVAKLCSSSKSILEDVVTYSWRHLGKMPSRHLYRLLTSRRYPLSARKSFYRTARVPNRIQHQPCISLSTWKIWDKINDIMKRTTVRTLWYSRVSPAAFRTSIMNREGATSNT